MDRRQARKLARELVSGLIDAQLGVGWPFEFEPYEDFEDVDQLRLTEALRELRDKLGDN